MHIHRRHAAMAAALAGLGLLLWLAVLGPAAASADATVPDTHVRVSSRAVSQPISRGFLGVSMEYPSVEKYMGSDPQDVNPVLEQLLRNLSPGGAPVLRIGGNSTDTTWWPLPGAAPPPWVAYSLSHQWLATVRTVAQDIGAKLILGVNLEAGSHAVAAAEAAAFVHGLGAGRIEALELGNEPTRYRRFPWYHANGRGVLARSPSYDFPEFDTDFAHIARSLPRRVRVAGPTFAGFGWMGFLPTFLAAQTRIGLVTFHRYTLNRCAFSNAASTHLASLERLLSTFASRYGEQSLAGYVSLAHRHGLPFRVDEMNSVACGGQHGVSDVFASALWSIDALFALARIGVDGANIHTFPGAAYGLFSFKEQDGQWSGTVRPEYYGLLTFARATPPGSRLLALRTSGSDVRTWATRGRDGTIRVVLINDDPRQSHSVVIRSPSRAQSASATWLTAPSVEADDGITLGGSSFATTTTGLLPTPQSVPLTPVGGHAGLFAVSVAAGSEATVTIPAG